MKELLGKEYYDYNLVLSLPNSRPMEGQVISRSFKALTGVTQGMQNVV